MAQKGENASFPICPPGDTNLLKRSLRCEATARGSARSVMAVQEEPVTIRAYQEADYDEIAALWTPINRELAPADMRELFEQYRQRRGQPAMAEFQIRGAGCGWGDKNRHPRRPWGRFPRTTELKAGPARADQPAGPPADHVDPATMPHVRRDRSERGDQASSENRRRGARRTRGEGWCCGPSPAGPR